MTNPPRERGGIFIHSSWQSVSHLVSGNRKRDKKIQGGFNRRLVFLSKLKPRSEPTYRVFFYELLRKSMLVQFQKF